MKGVPSPCFCFHTVLYIVWSMGITMEKLNTNKKLLKFNSILKELKYRPYLDIIIFVAVLSLKLISLNFMIGGFMDMRPALLISVIGSVLMLAGPFMLLPLKPRMILLLLADLGVSFIIFAKTRG